ncbi:hypothetical protein N0V95_009986 [Ascochyta clinopodiicola]|nr:hypothetical protein N0V95_009986 [Ascochyta clinopodiicola]
MKVFHLALFVLVGICFAVPTPADGDTTSAVEAHVDVPSEAPSPDMENETPNRNTPENLSRISISISEYCNDGVLEASGWLSNGQVKFELHLNAEQVTKINLHPGYDQLVGPYDFASHTFDIDQPTEPATSPPTPTNSPPKI